MLTKQLIDLRNVRTENLKCRTDLLNRFMVGWSVTQEMIILSNRLLKNL